jgi:hypothetical protein
LVEPAFEVESVGEPDVGARLFRVERNRLLANGRIQPEILSVEPLNSLDIGVRQADVRKDKLRIVFQRLLEELDSFIVILLTMSLSQRHSLKIKVVGSQAAGGFALEISPFLWGKSRPQRRDNLLCKITSPTTPCDARQTALPWFRRTGPDLQAFWTLFNESVSPLTSYRIESHTLQLQPNLFKA